MEASNKQIIDEMKVQMVEWFDSHVYKIDLINSAGVLETRWVPSVTTKLGIIDKPFLAKWRGDIGNREADTRLFESQQRGTRIHYAWSIYCLGGAVIYNPWNHPNYTEKEIGDLKSQNKLYCVLNYQDEMYALIKLQKCVEIIKPKMLFSERTVYSLSNNDAGTVDNIWEIKEGKYPVNGKTPLFIPGGRYVVDLKNGNQVSDEAYYQTAAYLKCCEEMGDPAYAGTLILHTSSKNRNGIEGFGCQLSLKEEVENHYKTYRLAASLWERKNPDFAPNVFSFPSLIKLKESKETV